MRFRSVVATVLLAIPIALEGAADYPSVQISSGSVRAKVYLPDPQKGFYRGTRFDWAGVVVSLQANGHNYYGPWFNQTDPLIHDFIYRGTDIVAGPCSAITGPVDEFGPLGYDDAKVGGTFVKIGIGALRKAGDEEYDNYHLYEMTNGGKWTIQKHRDELNLTQQFDDPISGYSYLYEKDLRLTKDKTELVLTHRLKNAGKRSIQTTVYNHNFLVLDHQPPGPYVTISFPFTIHSPEPPKSELAKFSGSQITYLKTLEGQDTVASSLEGFTASPNDNRIRIENNRLGAGLSWQTDRPLLREYLWSIRTVIAVEPFVSINIEPGAEFSWKSVYDYYALPKIVP